MSYFDNGVSPLKKVEKITPGGYRGFTKFYGFILEVCGQGCTHGDYSFIVIADCF